MKKSNSQRDAVKDSAPTIPARLAGQKLETHDTKSYFFETAHPLTLFKAGSHINIELEIEGVVVNRTYTLSSSPKQRDVFSITVKRVAGGLVSNWLFSHLHQGDTILVSQPQGQFVLPYQPPGRLLMLSAGSGITPLMSMLRYLSHTGNQSEITFLHYARSVDDLIFGDELKSLAAKHQNVSLHFVVEKNQASNKSAGSSLLEGRINPEQLSALVPDLASQEIYLCGPQPFMEATIGMLDQLNFNPSQLHQEHFSADLSLAKQLAYSAQLTFSASELSAQSAVSKTILEEAEALGLSPASACRMGICRTCQCKKQSGVTVNVVTGEESSENDDYILPCVSVAKTDTVVSL